MRVPEKETDGNYRGGIELGPNLTSTIVTNATKAASTSNYDLNLAVTIAAIALLLTLLGLLYKFGHHVGEIKGIKELVDANLLALHEKYNTKEEIQKIQSDLKYKADKDYVDMRIKELLADIELRKEFERGKDISNALEILRKEIEKEKFAKAVETKLDDIEKEKEKFDNYLNEIKISLESSGTTRNQKETEKSDSNSGK